jgi:hypothetical protein
MAVAARLMEDVNAIIANRRDVNAIRARSIFSRIAML